MRSIAVIIARAGSKGLRGKGARPLFGRPLIAFSIDHGLASQRTDKLVVSTDCPIIAGVARDMGVEVIDRAPDLSDDHHTIDTPVRHAVSVVEEREGEPYDAVVILYGNIPLRPDGLIDDALEKLEATGADSVQSVSPIGKSHPWWTKMLGGDDNDVIIPFVENTVFRRQDLPPAYGLNGAISAVRRECLFNVIESNPHAFLGDDRRAIVTPPGSVVDIDTAVDLYYAEAILKNAAGQAERKGLEEEAFTIGDCRLGPNDPVYIVAELGVNHDGSVDRALELTRAAADAGADAIKLQLFDPRLLLSGEAVLADYQKSGEQDVFDMLSRLQLEAQQMTPIAALARELGLGFIVTCFDLELIDAVRGLDVDAVKVASPDAVNLPLIEALHALDRPMIISTGTCELEELVPAVALCADNPPALLHCVSSYPAPIGTASLGAIAALRDRFDLTVGYSDHTTRIGTGMLAVAAGARIIEKHFTYDQAADGPDHAASFDPAHFGEYIQQIRDAEREVGPIEKRVLDCEREVRTVSRQSVSVTRDLPAGHCIDRTDLTVKRPGTGIPAARLNDVVGRTLTRQVKANSLLHQDDLIEVLTHARAVG